MLGTAQAAPAAGESYGAIRMGAGALERGQFAAAVQYLEPARARYPKLADYVGYWLGSAHYELKDYAAVERDLQPVWKNEPPSPLAGNAALLAGRAWRDSGSATQAIAILREYYSKLPQPSGDMLLASCYQASGDGVAAAASFQRAYYLYPNSPEAAQAAEELARLKTSLGDNYPPPTAQMMFQRAERWQQAGEYTRARSEYESILSRVAGADRDLARVRLGVMDFLGFQNFSALGYLKGLEVSSPEADAERLYYWSESARRLDKDAEMMDAINRLERLHPQSPWRLKALVAAGNRYFVQNRPDLYEPLYRAGAADGFGSEPQAEYCHWKVTWLAYLRHKPDVGVALRDHLVRFPGSEKDSAVLYFLGRLAEAAGDFSAAKTYYNEIQDRYPNHYYAGLVEQRLAQPELFRAVDSAGVREFLKTVVWPVRRTPGKFEPSPVTLVRMERYRALSAAGLDNLAEQELRFAARNDGQPHLVAMQLAQKAASPYQALRLMKNLAPGYMAFPLDSAPQQFWRLLFPLPFRTALESNARLRKVDPYVFAGLIRQESEFNPQAVSVANAYGLAQIRPSTGRELMRKLGTRRFRASVLFRPEINLRLGAMYLRQMYEQHAGAWEATLAAYNAGGSRVQTWNGWATYREPAEFIESIPFTETRNYVFSVLRNAQMYRQIYSGAPPAPEPKLMVKKAAPVVKKAPFKRAPVKRAPARHRRHRLKK